MVITVMLVRERPILFVYLCTATGSRWYNNESRTGLITFATVLSVILSIKRISRLVIAEVVNDITLLDDRTALAVS